MRKNILSLIFKITVALLAYGFIAYRLKSYDFQDFMTTKPTFYLLVPVLFLMPPNWFVESYKWQILLRNIEKITTLKSLKAVFIGLTYAVFTPNRIGELGGRVVILQKPNKLKGVFATATGSLSQLSITLILGFIAAALLLIFFPDKIISFQNRLSFWLASLLILVSGIIIYLFFNLDKFLARISRIPPLKKRLKYIDNLENQTKKTLLNVLILSLLRYIVFFTQFYVLLLAFHVEISVLQAFIGTGLSYFIMASLPSITLAELGIRASVSVFFIGMFSTNESGIIAASALLWFINVALPAIIGSVLMFRQKKEA